MRTVLAVALMCTSLTGIAAAQTAAPAMKGEAMKATPAPKMMMKKSTMMKATPAPKKAMMKKSTMMKATPAPK